MRRGRGGLGRSVAAVVLALAGSGAAATPGEDARFEQTAPRPIEVTPEVVANIRRAADLGDPSAQITLGFFYEGGQGVPVDLDRAAYWYGQAADGGAPRAAHVLGLLHERGGWTNADPVSGLAWLDVALALGRAEAGAARTRLAASLSPNQRAAAAAMAARRLAEIQARISGIRR